MFVSTPDNPKDATKKLLSTLGSKTIFLLSFKDKLPIEATLTTVISMSFFHFVTSSEIKLVAFSKDIF